MTKDDMIRLAQEAGVKINPDSSYEMKLQHFAALVAAAERETCAKREWIDLTATEIKILRRAANNDREFAELLQAKLKEKNNV